MCSFPWSVVRARGGVLALAVALGACTPRSGAGPAPLPVAPFCTLLATTFTDNPKGDSGLVSERTDPASSHGFTRLRGVSLPRGNPALGFKPDVYGISEAWLRRPGAPTVVRAQAHPARIATGNFNASAWSLNAQDATGAWSPPFATGSANRGDEVDDPETGGLNTPQLMAVGVANPQLFACAGGRSQDDALRTTVLLEVTPPDRATGAPGGVRRVQDVLNGDDRFVPNRPGPIPGPPTPPTPTLSGRPGNPVRDGRVECAMTQSGDDVATRELHLLTVHNGVLYHAMASNWSTATTGGGATFQRFNTVSAWADVAQALGRSFGRVVSATLVASRPTALSVFFDAEVGGRHWLWHAVRFSAGTGSWRAADDVLALSGDSANGTAEPFRIAAGVCPLFGEERAVSGDSELVYVMYRLDRTMTMGRILSTQHTWSNGSRSIYSPLSSLTGLLSTSSVTSRNHRLERLTVSTRPFRDDPSLPP
jgi:hypothetical protein